MLWLMLPLLAVILGRGRLGNRGGRGGQRVQGRTAGCGVAGLRRRIESGSGFGFGPQFGGCRWAMFGWMAASDTATVYVSSNPPQSPSAKAQTDDSNTGAQELKTHLSRFVNGGKERHTSTSFV